MNIKLKIKNMTELTLLSDLSCYEYESGSDLFDRIFNAIIEKIYYDIDNIFRLIRKNGEKKSYTLTMTIFEALALYELYNQFSKSMDFMKIDHVALMRIITPLDKKLNTKRTKQLQPSTNLYLNGSN